ncbi:hypothetical protein [Flavobacterium hungaricum]|uniref:Uncharacterized protein n=1 Tax=Flavobacterium hungaricum TaxID=2082725 RepID=A0ABR9TF69_9FLAO|nr:hypothetical protein [Flavobacterium hungaricum]MBE8723988.1 hypothetical protein [Flavobacterium hungaricum]
MEERKLWLDAVEFFRNDIDSKINCPTCKTGTLFTIDVAFEIENSDKGGERYIKCTHCNALEIVLYRKPPNNWFSKNDVE